MLSTLIDNKDLVTGLIVTLVASFLLFVASRFLKLRPKIHITILSENHQINLSNRFFTFGWDTPDIGEQEYTISHIVKVKLENISNTDAYYPSICFSEHNFQFNLEPLTVVRLKSGDSIELNGHYYHTINANSKPQYFEFEDFLNLEVVLNYKNNFGMRFHTLLRNNRLSYSIISGFKTLYK